MSKKTRKKAPPRQERDKECWINIRISDDLRQEVRELRSRTGIPISTLVRAGLQRLLDEFDKKGHLALDL